ncbi:MAG TPA: nuclear transport factor 2 family protein [Solirubrobacterales bacterium]|nr:nuclear transport factor 2 family protein [Solirubrobacterales bacterium]
MREAPELAELMRAMYTAIEVGDQVWFEERISAGPATLLIGSDPDEWWDGRETALRGWRAQLPVMAGTQLRPTRLTAFAVGDVGYAADLVEIRMPDGTEAVIRFSAVFEREGEKWKLVHSHGSVAAANEETIGREIPEAPR